MIMKGQTVAVTGASGNLGRAVADAFQQCGANLVLIDRDQQRLEKAFGVGNSQRMLVAVDLQQSEQTAAAVNAALTRFARIDVLCNLAGGFRIGPPVHLTPQADWDFLYGSNMRSMLNAVRAVVPGMIENDRGKIVNVGANAALKGIAGMGAYCASKDAVIRLTESMAAELRSHHVNVNCVLPGTLDTPENRAAMPDADTSVWVGTDALAEVILFLASDRSRAINGAAIPVTGGS